MPLSSQRRSITIHRDDHITDSLGAIFLAASEERSDAIIDRLREYLGPRVRVLRAEVGSREMTVDVAAAAMTEEAERMVEGASGLRSAGARRGAQAMLEDALELDPLNLRALAELAGVLAERGRLDDALTMFRRAREAGGDNPELLLAMAATCAKLDRTASAIAYLERALEIDPSNMKVRAALMTFGRRPPPVPTLSKPARLSRRR